MGICFGDLLPDRYKISETRVVLHFCLSHLFFIPFFPLFLSSLVLFCMNLFCPLYWLTQFPDCSKFVENYKQTYPRIPVNTKQHKHKENHIMALQIKFLKTSDTEKILKLRLISSFSSKTVQTKRQWNNILKPLEETHHQPRILYPV